jgi:integrase
VRTDAYQAGNFTRWLTARRDHVILGVLAYAAARRKETRGLRILDIDLPTDERLLTLHGKRNTSRTIKIPSVLADIVDAYLTDVRPHVPANPYAFTDLHPTGPDTDEHGRPLPRLGNEVIYRSATTTARSPASRAPATRTRSGTPPPPACTPPACP